MKPIYITILSVVVTLVSTVGCSKTTKVTKASAYVSYETTCMGVEHDGSHTLRVWGKGPTKDAAIEQAKKNAVYDILFKGTRGSGECEQRPLVTEVNARERYAGYFNPFFANGGDYLRFVREESANEASRLEAKGSSIYNYGIIATVDREGLRSWLESKGIPHP